MFVFDDDENDPRSASALDGETVDATDGDEECRPAALVALPETLLAPLRLRLHKDPPLGRLGH